MCNVFISKQVYNQVTESKISDMQLTFYLIIESTSVHVILVVSFQCNVTAIFFQTKTFIFACIQDTCNGCMLKWTFHFPTLYFRMTLTSNYCKPCKSSEASETWHFLLRTAESLHWKLTCSFSVVRKSCHTHTHTHKL